MNEKEYLDNLVSTSESSYESLKSLLTMLEKEESRAEARIFLEKVLEDHSLHVHLEFLKIPISNNKGWEKLTLLQLPSAFAPEEWSYTFYEGLNRYPQERYSNKRVSEVGCGNGWISLSLGIKTDASVVYGVDINPKAIVLSKLNLYLNALDGDGKIKELPSGGTLLEKVHFYESNLLEYFIKNNIQLDLITGCIPQVLSPDVNMKFTEIEETLSDEELYDLSNYAPSLGYVEDQFGLGLIAKALEQSIEILHPSGRVVLNLGGRPGHEVLESLFLRRGFYCNKIWQTKVWQAQDTDIAALVEIEKSSAHRFEFFTSLTNDVPISASLAQVYSGEQGKISHSLCVYEGKLDFPNQIKKVHAFLKDKRFSCVLDHLDLSIEDKHILEEKIDFLSFLSDYLQKHGTFGYEDVCGIESFREKLSQYFNLYFQLPLSKDNVLMTPSRVDLFRSIVGCYKTNRIMISDTYYKSSKEPGFRKVLRDAVSDGEILECPANVEVCSKIVGSVKPEILITDLGEWESVSTVAIESLIRTCKESGTKLFVDVSNVIELSSQPNANGVFRYLSENGFGPDVSVFGSFVRNAVYKKLSVCFVLSKNEFLLNSLKNAAELTYSRVPVIPQLYYEAIFNDLLAFQLSELKLKEVESFHSPDGHFYQTQLTDHAKRAFDHNSIKSEYRKFDDDSIRLDYGENELGVSISFKRSVFECFAKKNLDVNHNTLKELVRSKLSCEFGISSPGKLLFSLGAAPIYSELCYLAAKDKKKLIFPKGNYGMFHAAATYNGCELIEVDTLEKDGFKLTPGILNDVLKENPGSWVYLQYPVLNPTGQLLDRNELDSLLKVAKVHSAKIIIDTVFGGLVFSEGSQNFDSDVFLLSNKTDNSIDAFVLGGPSKEFAAGGLRVGFVWGNNAELMEKLNSNLSKPHDTSLAVYQDLLNHASKGDSDLITKQEEQRLLLASHAKRLTAVLEEFGWDVLAPRGGLFLMAKEPSHYPKDFNEQLFTKHNVSINSSEWTGIEGYSRFVLSVESAKFEEALKRLKAAFSGYNNK